MKYIRIPLDRLGVLIGNDGENKIFLEKKSGIKININSKNGEITLDEHEINDPLMLIKLENIIRATINVIFGCIIFFILIISNYNVLFVYKL